MKSAPLVAVLGLALWTSTASAAVIPVPCAGTTGDSNALVAAINEANAVSSPDTLTLGRGCTYTFTQSSNGWYGTTSLPAIASDITVEGNGATLRYQEGFVGPSRFFFVGADPADPDTLNYVTPGAGKLTIRNLTLTGATARGGGSNGGGGGAGLGGAIFNQGTLVVERSTFVGNTALGGASGHSTGTSGGGGLGAGFSNSGIGGGMGFLGGFVGSDGGSGSDAGGGGGAGIRESQPGTAATPSLPGDGGGERTATGGFGQGINGGMSGDGSGGGGSGTSSTPDDGGAGGRFGSGGMGFGVDGGGGGGAGGGGGGASPGAGGGGGFGGGGGWGLHGGGSGGCGGGAATHGASGDPGAPGFGGGNAATGPNRGGGGAGLGGAIFNMQGSVTVTNSTFTGNSAEGGPPQDLPDPGKGMGGALFNMSGTVVVVGSTFALNSATHRGTSIYNLVYDGNEERLAKVTLRNTIVARGTGAPEDLVSDETDYNLPVDRGTADAAVGERNIVQAMAAREDGTITGTPLSADPLLGALASNGGLTRTMAPGNGSPALDAGAAYGLTIDQRGLRRTVDLPTVVNFGDATDIGAVERQLPAPPGGNQPVAAFGARTLVSLTIVHRVGPRGPLRVIVRNRNTFPVRGRLGGRSAKKLRVGTGRRRVVRLRAKRLTVAAGSRKTIRLRLPRAVRRTLRRNRRIALRLTARVADPAGNVRTVRKRAKPRLRLKRRAQG